MMMSHYLHAAEQEWRHIILLSDNKSYGAHKNIYLLAAMLSD